MDYRNTKTPSTHRSSFPLFHSGQVFHELVCPLTVVLPQTFFSLTTLFPYPVFFCLFHAPLEVVVHFLVFFQILQVQIVSFSVISIGRTDQEFLQWPRFFLFWRCLPGCFSHCCAEGGDHWLHVCIFIVHDDERYKLASYHSLEGFQHTGIFQLFEVKLESCVFWLADSLLTKVEDHHQQVVVTSNFYSWKTLCSSTVHSWSEALPH